MHHLRVLILGRLLVLPVYTTLGWKHMMGANTLAFNKFLVRQTFVKADLRQGRHSSRWTFIKADIGQGGPSSRQNFIQADPRQGRPSPRQNFVKAELHQGRPLSRRTFLKADIGQGGPSSRWTFVKVDLCQGGPLSRRTLVNYKQTCQMDKAFFSIKIVVRSFQGRPSSTILKLFNCKTIIFYFYLAFQNCPRILPSQSGSTVIQLSATLPAWSSCGSPPPWPSHSSISQHSSASRRSSISQCSDNVR